MRFLADMGVSMRVVESLRSSGHDVIHLRDEGLQRSPNGEIFQKAIREERIVLTFDRTLPPSVQPSFWNVSMNAARFAWPSRSACA